MIRLKQFIIESEDSLNKSLLKDINVELFNLVKESPTYDTTSDMINAITSILSEFDISLLGSDNQKFSGRLIDNKGSKKFNIGPISSSNDQKEMISYSKVILNVGWVKDVDSIKIKDCYIS